MSQATTIGVNRLRGFVLLAIGALSAVTLVAGSVGCQTRYRSETSTMQTDAPRTMPTGLFFTREPFEAQPQGARSGTDGSAVVQAAIYVPRAVADDPTAQRHAGNLGAGWPVIVFLNGRGECGTDGTRQLTQGLFPAVISKPEDWPFIILFPQKPDQGSQWEDHESPVLRLLEAVHARYPTDRSRVYLTGLSQGGHGTWMIAARNPSLFAAIAPVCGYGPLADPADLSQERRRIPFTEEFGTVAGALTNMPVWAFHGELDDIVPASQSRGMVAAINSARQGGSGPEPKLTVYPDLNHGSWDRAYREAGIGAWFLEFPRR